MGLGTFEDIESRVALLTNGLENAIAYSTNNSPEGCTAWKV
jgi:hypothetical protein